MEAHTISSPRLKCPILPVTKLKVEPHEQNSSKTNLWKKGEKVSDFHLEYKEESNRDYEFLDSAPIKIKNEAEELDQKESDLHLEESFYIKWETGTGESIDKSIDEAFNNDVKQPYEIKRETNDVKVETSEEVVNYSYDPIKSEVIEHGEVHIKHEEDKEDKLRSKKISKPREQAVLHRCPECPYKTAIKSNLKRHSLRHKNPDEVLCYSCQECPYKTSQRSNLKAHTEIHNNLLLKCLKCSYETLRSSELKKHQMEHQPNIQWLYCPECTFKSHQPSRIQKHILSHKSDAFKCSKCPYQSRTKGQLTVHQVRHESMDKWHSCPLCSFKTYDRSTLTMHCRRRHSTDPNNLKQSEVFKCMKCSFESGCKYTLKKHQLFHDESRWFDCPDCVYKTPYKRSLQEHQLRHQGENAEGWHRCSVCPYKTAHKNNLRKHVMLHKSADEARGFECSQCSFRTTQNSHLKRHELKHKEAPEVEWFFCYECSFKTKYKTSLPKHMLKHKTQIDNSDLQNNGK